MFALLWTFVGVSFNLETFISLKTPFFAIIGFVYSTFFSWEDYDDTEFAESYANDEEYDTDELNPNYIEEVSDDGY